jgi:hypothetical protein
MYGVHSQLFEQSAGQFQHATMSSDHSTGIVVHQIQPQPNQASLKAVNPAAAVESHQPQAMETDHSVAYQPPSAAFTAVANTNGVNACGLLMNQQQQMNFADLHHSGQRVATPQTLPPQQQQHLQQANLALLFRLEIYILTKKCEILIMI